MRYLLVSLLLMLAPAFSLAAADQPMGTRVSLSAMVEVALPNDEVEVMFRVEEQGKEIDKIRQSVNRVTAAIKKRLAREQDLLLATTSRHLQPVWQYPKNGERVRVGWQLVQTGSITSSRLDEVAGWLNEIEAAGAHLSGLQYRISSGAMEKAREELSLQALRKFRDKAASIARGLDAGSFRIVTLSTESHTPTPLLQRREMAMMAAAAEADPPALSAGEGVVRLTVSGEVEMPPKDYSVR